MADGVVLLLDDDPDDRELMAIVLSDAGYGIIEATTGEDALQLAREHRPDLIIADILMPRMNGYEFVRRLREEPEVGPTRVVFCTAHYLEGEVRELAASCGVSQLISKPAATEVVLGTVSEALERPGSLGPRVLPGPDFEHEQLRVINDKLVEKVAELEQLSRDRHAGDGTSDAALGSLNTIASCLTELRRRPDSPEAAEALEQASQVLQAAADRLSELALGQPAQRRSN